MSDTNNELLRISKLRTVIKGRNGDLVPVDGVDICVPPHATVGLWGNPDVEKV